MALDPQLKALAAITRELKKLDEAGLEFVKARVDADLRERRSMFPAAKP